MAKTVRRKAMKGKRKARNTSKSTVRRKVRSMRKAVRKSMKQVKKRISKKSSKKGKKGKKKLTPWNKQVAAVFKSLQKTNPKATLGDAMKQASKDNKKNRPLSMSVD